jgi:AraC-like DNA-binding protein
VTATRAALFESDALRIGLFAARPASDACGQIEQQDRDVVVLPFSGLFSRHDGPNRCVLGTPSHAMLIRANTSYRIGFPGAIGDRAVILRFDDGVAPELLTSWSATHGLLPARAILARDALRGRLSSEPADALEVESRGFELLGLSLAAMRADHASVRHAALIQRQRAAERVKAAVAADPSGDWSMAKLGAVAHMSPFHLSRVFRQLVGASLHDYVTRERLAFALDRVLESDDDLSSIALESGFSSHSHFTARFRRFFGRTPTRLRNDRTVARMAETRTIVTARARAASLH